MIIPVTAVAVVALTLVPVIVSPLMVPEAVKLFCTTTPLNVARLSPVILVKLLVPETVRSPLIMTLPLKVPPDPLG